MSPLGRRSAGVVEALVSAVSLRFFAPVPRSFRAVRTRLRLGLEVIATGALLTFVLGRGEGSLAPSFDLAAGGFVVVGALVIVIGYVHEVGTARRFLRDTVSERLPHAPEDVAAFEPSTLRGRSLFALGTAFAAALSGEPSRAETALRDVQREDLGPWESRVYDATRTLAALGRGDLGQAARYAPLALATGHGDVDRTVALALVRGGWNDRLRLAAVERALSQGGPEAVRLAALARLRLGTLQGSPRDDAGCGGGPAGLDPSALLLASADARAVGDRELAERLLADAESGGVYR